MRLEGRTESANVEDRRGQRMRGGPAGVGCGGLLLVLVISYATGQDPGKLLQLLGAVQQQTAVEEAPADAARPQDQLGKFAALVLADTEETWRGIFQETGQTYREPPLVLFSQAVRSGCGTASSAMGPFYCPADAHVYIDLGFYDDLKSRFRAPGDFAQAYVIAHEVGHHVQNLLGTTDRAERGLRGAPRSRTNAVSVRVELQADFFAGVWAHHAQKVRNILEPGDIDEALNAATAIGDDRLQRESTGHVVPDSFTHGTSAQRRAWFRRGFESGDMTQGDTFDDRLFEEVGRR